MAKDLHLHKNEILTALIALKAHIKCVLAHF
jgi:hypothetical protein